MTSPRIDLRPAAAFVQEVQADLAPAARSKLDAQLRALEALTTIRGSYQDEAGRAAVAAFLSDTATTWRGPVARRIKGHLRANLASGTSPLGAVSLLGDFVDGGPSAWTDVPDE